MKRIWKTATALFLSACLLLALAPAALAGEEAPAETASAEMPESGTTEVQPFVSGTAGSANFRIPSLVTLADGSLLAAIDARWDHQGDACSLDTIVSVSKDNGATWTYSFPNYFNDSINEGFYESTAFIDPVTVVGKDGTIYMMVDLFPGGIGLNTAPTQPAASTGYVDVDGVQRMAIYESVTDQTDDNYTHYVGDFEEGFAPVIARAGGETAAYVDEHYYLYDAERQAVTCEQIGSGAQIHANVFFTNAKLHVRGATFLWLVSSKDNGETWSAPTILNPMVRRSEGTHQFYGVGPGAGLCLSDGTLIMPCYTFTAKTPDSSQIASFVYSTDNGRTWARSEDATAADHWSSESVLVEIDENTVRHFYRDGYKTLFYTDHTRRADGSWKAGQPVDTGVLKDANNQLAAIRYSKPINGKAAIIVSTATVNRRTNGRLYTFTLNADNTMELASTFVVNRANFAYSSLTELADGSIGLLYERTPEVVFERYDIHDVANGAVVDGKASTVDVPLYGTWLLPMAAAPTQEELASVDTGLVSVEVKTGDNGGQVAALTGIKEGETSFTSGGVDYTLRVAPVSLKHVNLSVGQSTMIQQAVGEQTHDADAAVARAQVESIDTTADLQGRFGTDRAFTGELTSLRNALYQVSGDNGNGLTLAGKAADGTTVYLDVSNGGYGHPNVTTEGKVFLEDAGEGSFYVRGTANDYLFFWRTGGYNYFDRRDTTEKNEIHCAFQLYRPAAEGETSSAEIPGYVKLTTIADAEAAGQLLLVAQVEENRFVLYPNTASSGSRYPHVLKIKEAVFPGLVIEGKACGVTDVMVDGMIYRVSVGKAFEDVASTSWAAPAVNFVTARGLISGVSETGYAPAAPMTRGDLAEALYRLAGKPAVTGKSGFTDVTDDNAAVIWAAERGVITGNSDGTFRPDAAIARQELAAMLYRYAGSPAVSDKALGFEDAADTSAYALDAVRWAVENGVVGGKPGNLLDPKGQVTRAETAQMLMNFLTK